MSLVNSFPSAENSSGGIDYSLSEQDTGLKWVDGKKIYQKTINCGSFSGNSQRSVSTNISNFESLVDARGFG